MEPTDPRIPPELPEGIPDRGWCTAFRRYLRTALGPKSRDRDTWPPDLRAAYEAWERSELERKAAIRAELDRAPTTQPPEST